MIALIASGRGGGEGPPVFFTVPWSPHIAERGEMPGRVWQKIIEFHAAIRVSEDAPSFTAMSEPALILQLLQRPEFDLRAALGITLARRIMLELGMLP